MTDEFRAQLVLLLRALHRAMRRRGRRRSWRRAVARAKRARFRARYKDAIQLAKTRPCTDCGLFYGAAYMEFDHRPEERKRFSIGDGKVRSFGKLAKEIAKTDVVCCACHERREAARGRTHGDGVGPRACPNVALRGTLVPVPLPGSQP